MEHELLEGHLGITKELLAYHSIQKRYSIGCEDGGDKLLVVSTLVGLLLTFNQLVERGGNEA